MRFARTGAVAAIALQLLLIGLAPAGGSPAPGPVLAPEVVSSSSGPAPIPELSSSSSSASAPTPVPSISGARTPTPALSGSTSAPTPEPSISPLHTPTHAPTPSALISSTSSSTPSPATSHSSAPAPSPSKLTTEAQAHVVSSDCYEAHSPSGSPAGAPSTYGLVTCNQAQVTSQAPSLQPSPPPARGPTQAPPPPNTPGNPLTAATIPAGNTVLQASLLITGSAATNPISPGLQTALEKGVASVLELPVDDVQYVRTEAAGRRRLLMQDASRKLLQSGVTAIMQIDSQSSAAVYSNAQKIATANGNGALIAAVKREGGAAVPSDFTLAVTDLQSASATTTPQACNEHFHHWCLDNSSLSHAGVAGIIAGLVLFIVLLAAIAGFFVYRSVAGRRSRPAQGQFVAAPETREQTPEERALFSTAKGRGPVASPNSANINAAAR